MKKLILPVLFLSTAVCCIAQTNQDIQNYIDTYKNLAISEMIRTGVPAAITLAQGILESKAGKSELVSESNNHFGIKCKTEWTGSVVYHDDDKKGECFRVYANAEDSYRDHSDFLKSRPYYSFLFQLDPTDYIGWAKGLKKAGYAVEKDYPQALIKLIVDNNLQQYTLIALQKERNPGSPIYADKNEGGNEKKIQRLEVRNTQFQKQSLQPPPIVQSAEKMPPITYPTGIFTINGTKVVFANAGTSLFALASNYQISFQKLLEFNDMDNTDILTKGQLIFLEKKPKKGATEYHIVTGQETLRDIAQEEGVRMVNLLEYNHLTKDDQPMEGEKIYLKSFAPASPKLLTAFNG